MVKGIEILDCSKISGKLEDVKNSEAFKDFSKKLCRSMQETGFVYLVNHDLSQEVVQEILSKARDFFQLPSSVKAKYRKRNPGENFNGFNAFEDEQIGKLEGVYKDYSVTDHKETLDFWGTAAHDPANFPVEIPALKDTVDKFRSSLLDLASKIFYAFAVFLGLDDKHFFYKQHLALFEDPTIKSHNFIRCNYYFPINTERIVQNRDELRLAEHCDVDTMSFLIQDETGGLEAKLPNGDWIPVQPIPGSIVLNTGSIMEVWAGGNLPATPHRVRLVKEKAGVRQSVALFMQPDGYVKFYPVVDKIKEDWIPPLPFNPKQTHFEYFSNILMQLRPDD